MIAGIERYYFLFFLALVWLVFAAVCDLRKREVPNWLSFSLIAFALAYRAFYATAADDWWFLLFGLIGFGIFFALAYLFYYARMFGGGDAKLLMGLGAVLPFESLYGLEMNAIGFLFVLFAVGAIYNIIYGTGLACFNWKSYRKELANNIKGTSKKWLILFVVFGVASYFVLNGRTGLIIGLMFLILPLLFVFMKALEKSCMIKFVSPDKLTDGDWIERDIKVGNQVIKKSVHGLSAEEVKMLKRAGKKVLIREGMPFAPAFLIAWIVMVFFYLVLGLEFSGFFSWLA
jgi:Flp pilus assembly protein protease CpaA